MSIYSVIGSRINGAFAKSGIQAQNCYDVDGGIVFPDFEPLPIPSGDLNAAVTIALPDIYNNGHGFTCTGLAYDAETDTFLIGDIGKETPESAGYASQIVRMSSDFLTVVEQIPLYTTFPSMTVIQGLTVDTSDGTIWFCSTGENKIRHISQDGTSIGSFTVSRPTGIAYSPQYDTFWVLNYDNKILHMSKSGATLGSWDFAYTEQLDQCFIDPARGYLYIVGGDNYTGRNNVYLFNAVTHQQSIACTVDSYSVEGLWIGKTEMVIVNDGYYHSAVVPANQVNIYNLGSN